MARPAQQQGKLEELSEKERARLKDAHSRLRRAAEAYEPFLGRRLPVTGDVPLHRQEAILKAQRELQAAEAELWRLREELLGWTRPTDAPSATQATEWILEEGDSADGSA